MSAVLDEKADSRALSIPKFGGNLTAANIVEVQNFATTMGKFFADAKVAGVKTTAEGTVLALVCARRGMDPFQFSAQYHLVDGKPTLQAYAILARIHEAGIDVDWNNLGEDCKFAEAVFTKPGKKGLTFRYSIEEATTAGVVKDKSAWMTARADMLRAAVIRKAAKIVCPELLLDDVDPVEFSVPTIDGEFTKTKQAAKPVATTPAVTATVTAATADPVIDVVPEQKQQAATTTAATPVEEAPFPSANDLDGIFGRTKLVGELTRLLILAQSSLDQFVAKYQASDATIKTIDDIPDAKLTDIISRLKAKLEPAEAAAKN